MKRWSLVLAIATLSLASGRASAAGAPPGATVPWTTYEAEQADTNGAILGPDYTGHTPAREASGRRCVALTATGQYVQFTAKSDAQGIVVRYCIPDSPDGQGSDTTLTLSISDQHQQKLQLTSRRTYLYGDYPYTNNPSAGTPRHFWDELRLLAPIHTGDTIRLEKTADDTASQYLIDFVDLETVPPPLPHAANTVSITDFGAAPNTPGDARTAFLAAIAAAKSQHKSVWIPPGQFTVSAPIEVADITLAGAGMWYSTLVGVADYTSDHRVAIYGSGSNVHLSDFAITGNLNYRNDTEPNDGLGGSFGTGSTIRNIWVEHTKTGAWLVNSDGLLVEGCRFRDTIADGINLCVGMRNTTVQNCTARGGGDDCFAAWPTTYIKPRYSPGNNRFIHCTAQLPFLAQGFSIYGGDSNSVQDCQAIDIPYGAGLFASTTFPTEFGFRGTTTYHNICLTRTGCDDGAIGTVANLLNLAGLRFYNIEILDSPADAIKFTSMKDHALSDTTFDHIRIQTTGLAGAGCGILTAPTAVGSATITNVSIQNAKTAAIKIDAPQFHLIQGLGNSGLGETGSPGAESAAAQRTPS